MTPLIPASPLTAGAVPDGTTLSRCRRAEPRFRKSPAPTWVEVDGIEGLGSGQVVPSAGR